MTQAKILIAEDDPVLAEALQVTLENLGYCVPAVYYTGEEVLAHAQKDPPDLVLMDIALRGELDGVETAERIRLSSGIPVIYITARAEPATIQRAISTAPFGYLLKPFQPRELELTIAMALQNRALGRNLRASEERYRSLTELSPYAVLLLDPDGVIVLSNPMAASLFGELESADLVGKSFFDLFEEKGKNRFKRNVMSELLDKGSLMNKESTAVRLDGRRTPAEVSASLVKDEKGNPSKIIAVILDISERKIAEEAIREQATRANTLAQVASQINKTLDPNQVLTSVCENVIGVFRVSGVSVTLIEEKADQVKIVASQGPLGRAEEQPTLQIHTSLFESIWKSGGSVVQIPDLSSFTGSLPLSHPLLQDVKSVVLAFMVQGEKLLGSINLVTLDAPRTFSADELSLLAAIADLASIAIAHAHLFEQVVEGRARLQSLSRQLVEVQETEKRFLAYELHDHIGQLLTGLQFTLEMGKVLKDQPLQANLSSAQEIVQDIMAQVREISLDLHPSLLDDLGLIVCLEWHFDRYTKQTGIEVQFSHNDIPDRRFRPEIEISAFRITQEALTNIARYAQVKEAFVSIESDENDLLLKIRDCGQGFDSMAAEADHESVGLIGMRERANLAGGLFEIHSTPGQGTMIEARLPIQNRLERRKNGRLRTHSR